jgi:regulator of protease activity HflC (stomatin/prohibitin superfamily)
MQQNRSFAVLSFVVILAVGAALAYAWYRMEAFLEAGEIGGAAFIIASLLAAAIQVADPWDRAVILRLGKFSALKGPGLFFIIPVSHRFNLSEIIKAYDTFANAVKQQALKVILKNY